MGLFKHSGRSGRRGGHKEVGGRRVPADGGLRWGVEEGLSEQVTLGDRNVQPDTGWALWHAVVLGGGSGAGGRGAVRGWDPGGKRCGKPSGSLVPPPE